MPVIEYVVPLKEIVPLKEFMPLKEVVVPLKEFVPLKDFVSNVEIDCVPIGVVPLCPSCLLLL